jgi:hypothetical protein
MCRGLPGCSAGLGFGRCRARCLSWPWCRLAFDTVLVSVRLAGNGGGSGQLNLLRMHCGVISSLHGPVTLKMLSSTPVSTGSGSTGLGGLHFPFFLLFPVELAPFPPFTAKSPVK